MKCKYKSNTIAQLITEKTTGIESNCYSILFENTHATSDALIYAGNESIYRTIAPGESIVYGGENPEILQKTVFKVDSSSCYVEREFLTKETCC